MGRDATAPPPAPRPRRRTDRPARPPLVDRSVHPFRAQRVGGEDVLHGGLCGVRTQLRGALQQGASRSVPVMRRIRHLQGQPSPEGGALIRSSAPAHRSPMDSHRLTLPLCADRTRRTPSPGCGSVPPPLVDTPPCNDGVVVQSRPHRVPLKGGCVASDLGPPPALATVDLRIGGHRTCSRTPQGTPATALRRGPVSRQPPCLVAA